jgi:HK97 family phage prohead protease/HK97 family phage major capsid protein
MMNKIFNLTSTFKALENDDGSVMIRGMASTADFDRAGDSISAEAWQKGGLKNFEKNPIILFNHDYDRPIGRATGMKSGPEGLELECKISKSAHGNVAELVKDGVLGAFSVGFRVKDADYIKETDGLMIKDAELFEVSVVSVPCNQAATFSLAKSFDSTEEYEEFKKTFTNRVDLAGQSLAKDEVITSGIASDNTPKSADINSADQEIKMDNQNIDLEAFAKKVAADTAAQIAMKQAEQKAAEQAVVEKAAEQASFIEAQDIKVKTGIQSGVEALMSDVQAQLTAKDAKFDEVMAKHSKDLEEKSAEITAMQNSKKTFTERAGKGDVSKWGQDFLKAHLLGVMTQKGMQTGFARDLQEKAGIDYTTSAADIDQEVSNLLEKEIQNELKVAQLFRELPVNGAATVLPIQPDVNPAVFQTGAATAGNLENRGASDDTFKVKQVILNAYRLISSSFMDNNVDEQVLINLMPMLIESVARAHGRAVENAIINGSGSITGLDGYAAAHGTTLDVSDGTRLTSALLLAAREGMGRYGVNPTDMAYIVSNDGFYDLLNDANFQTLDEVGSDLAARVTGTVGAVYGTPVIVSEEFAAPAVGVPAALCVNKRNYVIPRLGGVTVEQDYEVMNQRRVIVASQALGFEELVAGATGHEPVVKIDYIA